MILVNKQDLPDALSVTSVTRVLELDQYNELIWRVVGTSTASEQGVYEALDWLSRTIVKKADLAASQQFGDREPN